MKKYILLFFSILIFSTNIFSQKATEVRAVWITTNWGLDWPINAKASVEQQKKALSNMLDKFQAMNFNTVLFQAKAQGEVFFNSKLYPKSKYFNHANNFDPLAYAIEESHKRGMECHAWIITFPVEYQKMTGKGRRRKPVKEKKPENYTAYKGTWYLDPGHPDTKKQLVSLVEEVVSNYDVDGVHFDYIRYPSNDKKFSDDISYKKYGRGKDLYDWRRENINNIVSAIYDKVKSIKDWVQVSSSPLGRYRILKEVNPNDGWTAYETVFQDAGKWIKDGKHDLLFPMMYYRKHNFEPFLNDWVEVAGDRHVVPGIGVYQMMTSEQDWPIEDIVDQINYTEKNAKAGAAYFRAGNILNNLKGLKTTLDSVYSYPAKLPPMPWLNDNQPQTPTNLVAYEKDEDGKLYIGWDISEEQKDCSYTVYRSDSTYFDMENPKNIIATRIRGNHLSFPITKTDEPTIVYYTVTATNRYHIESAPCQAGFFIHYTGEK